MSSVTTQSAEATTQSAELTSETAKASVTEVVSLSSSGGVETQSTDISVPSQSETSIPSASESGTPSASATITEPTQVSSPSSSTTSSSAAATATSFPPDVMVADGPLSGWILTFFPDPVWSVADSEYFPPTFMAYNGIKTVNTICVPFTDNEVPNNEIPAGSSISFETRLTPNTDTCCVALFEELGCDMGSGKEQSVCDYPGDRTDAVTEFVVKSFQVYGCTGRM